MKVVTSYDQGGAVVQVEGRLDAEWSAALADSLDDLLRSGVRAAVIDLSQVSYVSSAGARVLTASAQDFAALRGELLVAAPPPVVADALGVAGLADQIIDTTGEWPERRLRTTGIFARVRYTQDWSAPATAVACGSYETSPYEQGGSVTCRVVGEGAAPPAPGSAECHSVAFPERVFGLGIGALGDSAEECGGRLGELLAAGGVVAYLPTDGALVPDYLAAARGHAPTAHLVSGLVCEGGFAHLVRFSTARTAHSVPLAEIADVCLDTERSDAVAIVAVAETAGLVGALRRRSPSAAQVGGASPFAPEALREWLTYTAEPAHASATALLVGVAARRAAPPLAAQLRPLRSRPGLLGHFHAGVFSYRPVPQRTVALQTVVATLFEHQSLRAVLHLLHDERQTGRAGESHFVRGLAWVAPITGVERATGAPS